MARFKVIDHTSALEEIVNPAAKKARELREHALILDVETTGAAADDEVIELAIVAAKDGSVLIDQKFKPSKKIEYHAQKVHGIKDYELEHMPTFASRYQEICEVMSGKTVLAWNVTADSRFMAQTFDKYGLEPPAFEWQCAMRLYQKFKELPKGPKLSDACDAMRVKKGTHRAVSDALAAARIIYRMAESAPEDEVVVFEQQDDESSDDICMTARDYLVAAFWREKKTASDGDKDAISLWINPNSGEAVGLSRAMDMQRAMWADGFNSRTRDEWRAMKAEMEATND